MPVLVGENQIAFIAGRQILNGALIVNAVITWLRRTKKPGALLKIDVQKAYDIVNSFFLDSVLQQMAFGSVWRGWINSCLSIASISVLVNKTPTTPFPVKGGLQEGDPLSPFLFVLVVEVLSKVLYKASSNGIFRGLTVGQDDVHISHL